MNSWASIFVSSGNIFHNNRISNNNTAEKIPLKSRRLQDAWNPEHGASCLRGSSSCQQYPCWLETNLLLRIGSDAWSTIQPDQSTEVTANSVHNGNCPENNESLRVANHSFSDRAVSSESKDFVFNLLVKRKGWYRCPSTRKDEQSTISSLQRTCQLHNEPHIFAESSSLMKPHFLSLHCLCQQSTCKEESAEGTRALWWGWRWWWEAAGCRRGHGRPAHTSMKP